MPDQILSQEELVEEIKATKKYIFLTLESLKSEIETLIKRLGDINDESIPLLLTDRFHLSSLVEKAVAIIAKGEKLDFLNDLKNKKTP